jgi:hypothetical protein
MSIDTAAVLMASLVAGVFFQSAVILLVGIRVSSPANAARGDAAILAGVLVFVVFLILGGLTLSGLNAGPVPIVAGMAVGAALVEIPWLTARGGRRPAMPGPESSSEPAELGSPPVAGGTSEDLSAALRSLSDLSPPAGRGSLSEVSGSVTADLSWRPLPDTGQMSLSLRIAGPDDLAGSAIALFDSSDTVHLACLPESGRLEFTVPSVAGSRLSPASTFGVGDLTALQVPTADLALAADTAGTPDRNVLRRMKVDEATVTLYETKNARTAGRDVALAVESPSADDDGSWLVLATGAGDAPEKVFVIPLTWHEMRRSALGALKVGAVRDLIDLHIVPKVMDAIELEDRREVLERSASRAADKWTEEAFRRALDREG